MMIMTTTRRTTTIKTHTTWTTRTIIRTTNMTKIYQLSDLIETFSFLEDIKIIKDKDFDNDSSDNDNNNEKGVNKDYIFWSSISTPSVFF